MDINTRDVRYFLAVAHAGSLTVASRECNVTEAALSKAISRVESAVGFPLFERSKRGMTLTQSGAQFHAHALKIRREHDDAMSYAADLRSGAVGFLRVGATRPVFDGLLSPAIARLAVEHPRLELRVFLDIAASLLMMLEQGQLDMVLAPLVGVAPRDVDTVALAHDELTVVARAGHPWFRKRPRRMAELLQYAWIIPPRHTSATKWLFERFTEAGLDPPKAYVEVDYAGSTSLDLAASTDLILLSPGARPSQVVRSDLRRVDIPQLAFKRPVYLVTRRDSYWSLSMKVLVEALSARG